MPPIDAFLSAVRRRLNARRALRITLQSLAAGAAGLLAVASVYFLKGYAVPKIWYPVAGGLTLVSAVTVIFLRRATLAEAGRAADTWFGLKDSVTSHLQFTREGRTGGFYDMQSASTRQAVQGLKASRIPLAWPRGLAAASGLLVLGAALTVLKTTSPAVIARENQERLTGERSETLRRELEEMIRELEKSADDPDERRLLQTGELKKWAAELKNTKNTGEAMRQLAELERRLDRAAQALARKREEQLLKKAAEELEKEEDPAARELARNLKNEQFREAAKNLESMKPKEEADKTLSEKRRELARLKAAARRMAAAARAQSPRNKNASGQDQSSSPSDPEEQRRQSLEDQLSELEKQASEYDEALKEAAEAEKNGRIDTSRLAQNQDRGNKLGEKLGQLGSRLKQLGAQKEAARKLQGLARAAGKGQGLLAGRLPSPFSGKGGKKPGDGTIDSLNGGGGGELSDNGQLTRIQGIKGTGPSLTQIEAAEDGTGVSRRQGTARERSFSRQFESFVSREDVPGDMKQGVKQYFQSIHDGEPAPAAGESPPTDNGSSSPANGPPPVPGAAGAPPR